MIFLTTAVTVLHRITGTQKTLVLRTGSLSIRFCTCTYYDSVTVSTVQSSTAYVQARPIACVRMRFPALSCHL
jgi:hypothetical protein